MNRYVEQLSVHSSIRGFKMIGLYNWGLLNGYLVAAPDMNYWAVFAVSFIMSMISVFLGVRQAHTKDTVGTFSFFGAFGAGFALAAGITYWVLR